MSKMKKIIASITTLACASMMMGLVVMPVQATTTEDLQAQIDLLLAQLADLQTQLAGLSGTTGTIEGCTITSFDRNLSVGMTGDDVKCLQIVLNTDSVTKLGTTGAGSPGNETSYFGPLTKAGVIKFQELYADEVLASWGLTSGTGYVGSTTRTKLNELLVSGVTPTGCNCTAWVDDVCGGGDCSATQMNQTRTCTPETGAAADVCEGAATSQCVADASCKDAGVVEPLSVVLSDETPVAANVMKGSALNTVTKFIIYGSEDEATTINGLTLKNYGTAETNTTTIAKVKILDENDVEIATERNLVGGTATFVIVPQLTIAQAGSRTLSVAVNVDASGTTMSTIQMGIDSADAINGATFTGDFPVKGEVFTVVPAGSLGTLTIAEYSSLPKSTAKIGETEVVLEKFTVSAGSNEDVTINQMTFTNTGTISASDISNLKVRKIGGDAVTDAETLGSNDKVTFNLTSPVALTKGYSQSFELIADIASGDNRTILMAIAAGAVVGNGATSGVNISSTGTTTADTVTIGTGTVSVSMSASHPQGQDAFMIQSTSPQTLAVFDVKATGEDVIFDTINILFAGTPDIDSTNYLSSVGLYEITDTGFSGVSTATLTVNAETVSPGEVYSLSWTVPAGTTKKLAVRGITTNLDVNDDVITITFSGYSGTGMSSGETISSTNDVASTAIKIYAAGTFTSAASTNKTLTHYNQGVLTPSANVVLGALKIRATRENMKLKDLIVTPSTTGKLGALRIFADDINVDGTPTTALTDSVSEASSVFTFDSDTWDDDILFEKNVYRTVLLVGNPTSTADVGNFHLTVSATTSLTLTGIESGTDADASAVIDFAISSPFSGGTFQLDTKVVEITKASDSPSGTISPTSNTVVGKWDVANMDAELENAVITAITFTTDSGIPTAITGTTDATLFKLYDGDGTQLTTSRVLTQGDGTIAFSGISTNLTVEVGVPKTIELRVDFTDSDWGTVDLSQKWYIAAYTDVTITDGEVGFGGDNWSIQSEANTITINL
ncbi:peptidoglycan-binding protein [Candidatus Parcubacteria bacterium]|nr:peptidoglycan-binding protein [Candidatus Parcubacteria bacterium]